MNLTRQRELMETIHFVRDNFHMTILLIEHDMKLVSGICEKLTVLNFGQVLACGETSDVLRNPGGSQRHIWVSRGGKTNGNA